MTVTVDEGPEGTTVAVVGELDMRTADALRGQVDDLDVAHRTLRLDLADVSFVDSSGLGALLGIKKQQDRGGGRLVLVHSSPAVQRVIAITRLDRVFDLVD